MSKDRCKTPDSPEGARQATTPHSPSQSSPPANNGNSDSLTPPPSHPAATVRPIWKTNLSCPSKEKHLSRKRIRGKLLVYGANSFFLIRGKSVARRSPGPQKNWSAHSSFLLYPRGKNKLRQPCLSRTGEISCGRSFCQAQKLRILSRSVFASNFKLDNLYFHQAQCLPLTF